MAKKELIILVGNIGCGKSTIARNYIDKGYIAIARDYIRYAIGEGKYIFNADYESIIWKTEQYMLRNFINLNVNIVVDEVGVSKQMRKNYIKLGKENNYNIIAVVLPRLSMEKAVNRRMNDPHGCFDKEVWQGVWRKFDNKYQEPTYEEGFGVIIKLK